MVWKAAHWAFELAVRRAVSTVICLAEKMVCCSAALNAANYEYERAGLKAVWKGVYSAVQWVSYPAELLSLMQGRRCVEMWVF